MKQVKNFLIETGKRLKGKTPSYFQVINWITGACAFVTGFPLLVAQAGIKLPADLEVLQNKTVSIAALVGLVVGKLTVQRTLPVANGLMQTQETDKPVQLPFTETKEKQQAIEAQK